MAVESLRSIIEKMLHRSAAHLRTLPFALAFILIISGEAVLFTIHYFPLTGGFRTFVSSMANCFCLFSPLPLALSLSPLACIYLTERSDSSTKNQERSTKNVFAFSFDVSLNPYPELRP